MSRRMRLGFIAACLPVFGLVAALTTWRTPSTGPSNKTPATVTLAPGAVRPASLVVTDLLQRYRNARLRVYVVRVKRWGPTPPRPVSSGATVIGDSDRLAASAASLLR
jgi:hypothetical protein